MNIPNNCITDAFLDQFDYEPVEPIPAIRAWDEDEEDAH